MTDLMNGTIQFDGEILWDGPVYIGTEYQMEQENIKIELCEPYIYPLPLYKSPVKQEVQEIEHHITAQVQVISCDTNRGQETEQIVGKKPNIAVVGIEFEKQQKPKKRKRDSQSPPGPTKLFICSTCQRDFKSRSWFEKHTSKSCRSGRKSSGTGEGSNSSKEVLAGTKEESIKTKENTLEIKESVEVKEDSLIIQDLPIVIKQEDPKSREFLAKPIKTEKHSVLKLDLDKILKENVDITKTQEDLEIVVNNQKFTIDKTKNLQPLMDNSKIRNSNAKSADLNEATPVKQKTKICPTCSKAYAQTGDLTRHLLTHSGLKPFKCSHDSCKYSFISSGDLKKHLRRHEKNVNPIPRNFSCDCGKTFERNFDLKRHKLRHLVEMDKEAGFRCDLCDKVFAR